MAKRYTFRLDTVLRLRKMTEDECRRTVASRLREIAAVEADVRRIDGEFSWEVGRSRDDQQRSSMDVAIVRQRRNYMGHLHRRRNECAAIIVELRKQLEREQAALAHASKEVKVLEKLRDRQQARQQEIEHRAERAEEDEIGQQMYRRFHVVNAG